MTDGPPDPIDAADDELDGPWHESIVEARETYGAPEVTALLGFVLAVASVFGFGLMNGTTYTAPFLTGGQSKTTLVIGLLVGAALALIPTWLGWRTTAQALPDDPRWVLALGRTALLLGLGSVALRLVIAVIQASHDGPSGFTRL